MTSTTSIVTLGVILIISGKMFKLTAGKWEKALSKDIR